MYTILIFNIICVILTKIDCASVLAVFPTPSISHQVVFRPLTQELARRGHKVVVVTPDSAFSEGDSPINLTEIDVHDVSYNYWREHFKLSPKGWKHDLLFHVRQSSQNFMNIFELQLQNEKFKQVLKEKFDLVIVEANVKPAFVMSHIFKAPMILISSLGAYAGNYDIVGAPTHVFLYPLFLRLRSYNLTLYEKVAELYNQIQLTFLYSELENMANDLLKRNFGPETPTVQELKKNVDLLFLNIHPILERNRPVPPNVVHLWGLHQKSIKKLPQELKLFLDNSEKGIVYVSFGSNFRSSMLPRNKIESILNVLSQLPYDVLLKWDEELHLENSSNNIRTEQWLPQSDLLGHPKIKLFITQGGRQSTDEAITAGVPLLGIPLFADQWHNTEMYIHLKIGLQLDLDDLNEENFEKAIYTIIGDSSYRQNIKSLALLLLDQNQPPLERAVWWVECTLRHGGARHLLTPAANITWWQYLEIDLVLFIVTIVLVLIILSLTVVYLLFRIAKSIFVRNIKIKVN